MPHASCRLEGKSVGDGPLFPVAADDSEGEGQRAEECGRAVRSCIASCFPLSTDQGSDDVVLSFGVIIYSCFLVFFVRPLTPRSRGSRGLELIIQPSSEFLYSLMISAFHQNRGALV